MLYPPILRNCRDSFQHSQNNGGAEVQAEAAPSEFYQMTVKKLARSTTQPGGTSRSNTGKVRSHDQKREHLDMVFRKI